MSLGDALLQWLSQSAERQKLPAQLSACLHSAIRVVAGSPMNYRGVETVDHEDVVIAN